MAPLPTFENLRDTFESLTKEATDRKFLIVKEIKAVEALVYQDPSTNTTSRFPDFSHIKGVFDFFPFLAYRNPLFTKVFEQYQINASKNSDMVEEADRATTNAALTIAKYFKWLQDAQQPKRARSADLTLNQKLLALHYLGMDFSSTDNSKLSIILSGITGQGGENIRKSLSYVNGGKNNKVRTKPNLKALNALFKKADLFDIADKIEQDLNKL